MYYSSAIYNHEKIYLFNISSWWTRKQPLTVAGIQILGHAQKWVFVISLTKKG